MLSLSISPCCSKTDGLKTAINTCYHCSCMGQELGSILVLTWISHEVAFGHHLKIWLELEDHFQGGHSHSQQVGVDCWWEAFVSPPWGPFHKWFECPHNMAADFSGDERSRERPRKKQWFLFLWSNLRRHITSFLYLLEVRHWLIFN